MFDRRARGRALRLLSWIGVLFALLFVARPASAYPWMIRHSYQGCVPCHSDPSGVGILTEYGRAMGENVLRTRYGKPPPDEAPVYSRFLFGVPTPEWLLLGGSVRNAVQMTKSSGAPFSTRFLQMEASLKAQITVSRFRAYGNLGYQKTAMPAQLTHRLEHNLVSREHWLGVDLGEDKQFLLRAGRINIPFGIRNDEHELFTRSSRVTRTNINESQQHGIAFAWNGEKTRGEVMALLGNYQLNPDQFRERGYAGYVEFKAAEWAGVGVSSMLTYAKADYVDPLHSANTIRQVHGAFARLGPKEWVAILAEADALITTTSGNAISTGGTSPGFVSTVQVDFEPTQGVHLIATGETWIQSGVVLSPTSPGITAKSFAGWLSAQWFFAPHADVRFDFVAASLMDGPVSFYLLPQFHVYL
jgi:hypothetical protein